MEAHNIKDITVREQEIKVDGEATFARILDLGQGDCMLVADIAELVDVTSSHIRVLLHKHPELVVNEVSDQNLTAMKELGVIPFKTTVVNLLPRETIEDLVKLISTPRAWAVYRQLWKEVRVARATAAPATANDLIASFMQLTTDHIVKVEVKTDANTDRVSNSRLDADQVAQIDQAIKGRAKALGFTSRAYCIALGSMRKSLKFRFLPVGSISSLTYKDLRQSDLPAAFEFLAQWNYHKGEGSPAITAADRASTPRLPAENISQLALAFKARTKSLGVTGRDAQIIERAIMAATKEEFLPAGARNKFSFKDIALSDVPAALDFIATWSPK